MGGPLASPPSPKPPWPAASTISMSYSACRAWIAELMLSDVCETAASCASSSLMRLSLRSRYERCDLRFCSRRFCGRLKTGIPWRAIGASPATVLLLAAAVVAATQPRSLGGGRSTGVVIITQTALLVRQVLAGEWDIQVGAAAVRITVRAASVKGRRCRSRGVREG
ncbi:hypothetical protein B0H66DRAFT_272124 [Apodospora peruviana]|uniref:Uncharacterized protein n=1 Tax=Apodospora peruviana TaxID=516989 RepID=A0AAE0HZJ9_9PEZI|nr:hypothetical protein B0H66DRAFT_272124 [Apodospora peruviana]